MEHDGSEGTNQSQLTPIQAVPVQATAGPNQNQPNQTTEMVQMPQFTPVYYSVA